MNKKEKRSCVLNPQSRLIMIWKVIINIVYIISFFLVPLVLINPHQIQSDVRWLDITMDLLLLIDIWLNFFIAFYVDTELVTNHKEIVIRYLTSYFAVEFIAVVPGLFSGEGVPDIYFFKILRYVHITTFLRYIGIFLNAVSDYLVSKQYRWNPNYLQSSALDSSTILSQSQKRC